MTDNEYEVSFIDNRSVLKSHHSVNTLKILELLTSNR